MKQIITLLGTLQKTLKGLNIKLNKLYKRNKEGLLPIEDYENYLA
jgi:hypothetical protein